MDAAEAAAANEDHPSALPNRDMALDIIIEKTDRFKQATSALPPDEFKQMIFEYLEGAEDTEWEGYTDVERIGIARMFEDMVIFKEQIIT